MKGGAAWWVRGLEVVIGPLPVTVSFIPAMLLGVNALSEDALAGTLQANGYSLIALFSAGVLGTAALWVAVLRGSGLVGTRRTVRLLVGLGLLLGVVSMATLGREWMRGCGPMLDCAWWALLLLGPTLVAFRHLTALLRTATRSEGD